MRNLIREPNQQAMLGELKAELERLRKESAAD
jgi:hypothetical protein